MADDDDKERKKGKDVSPLALDEIPEDTRAKKADDADDSWDDPPADIPDKPRSAQDLEAVYDIPVRVSAVLGKSSMQVNELLKLGRGAVVELDRKVGEAIDIYVNDRLVARGEVVVVDDRLGITMTEIIKTQKN
jgi:flagellar motor switch protein FliN/FliY